MGRRLVLAALAAVVVGSGGFAVAQQQASSSDNAPAVHGRVGAAAAGGASPTEARNASAKAAPAGVSGKSAMRIEGEKRFRTNCGRCHTAPRKFPPRTMATIVRHMRVRATITDEDMRLILRYMTQ
jgi:mono/diheme cytochrome c family protein